MAKAAPATRERPTGPAVAIAAAAPVDVEEVPVELDEPEVWLLDPDVVAVPVEKPEDTPVPVVVAVPVEVTETPEELPDSEAEPVVVDESGTTGDESPAGMDAAGG